MPVLVRHEQCPRCVEQGRDRGKDNLGVWPDGHKWCFSCGWKSNGDTLNRNSLEAALLRQKPNGDKNKNDNSVRLPDDFTVDLPEVVRQWLKRYEITDAEIEANWLGWTPQREQLVFPVFDKFQNLLMYQGRSFSSDPKAKKCYTEGFPEKIFHILGDVGGKSVCVVEDPISAIKVSRVVPCMPLWGSILSTPRLTRLTDLFGTLIIWLDRDKQEYATKRGCAARPFFDDVKVIGTDYDPKSYATEEIKEIMNYEFQGK